MTNYRRMHVPGATWFFTVNLADRRSRLLAERIDTLRAALRYVHTRHRFRIEAMVVLPDHLHAVWTLPPGDADYPMRLRLMKSWSSRHIPPGERRRASRVDKGERGIWQRRYWEHLVRDERRSGTMRGLRPFQPGETWSYNARGRLAAFNLPPLRRQGMVICGLGHSHRSHRRLRRTRRSASQPGFVGWVERSGFQQRSWSTHHA